MRKLLLLVLLVPLALMLTACGTDKLETKQYLAEYDLFLLESVELLNEMDSVSPLWPMISKEKALEKPEKLMQKYFTLPKNKQTEKYYKLLGEFTLAQLNLYKELYDLKVDGDSEETQFWLKTHNETLQKTKEKMHTERAKVERKLN